MLVLVPNFIYIKMCDFIFLFIVLLINFLSIILTLVLQF